MRGGDTSLQLSCLLALHGQDVSAYKQVGLPESCIFT